jgi:hypothetical protein
MSETASPVSFEADIRPLFRASDRSSMSRAFDLWSREDVASHAVQIAARLKDGSMPCDGPWPPSQITLFDAWVDEGLQP